MDKNEKYNIAETIKIFFSESREMLNTMESCLLDLEKKSDDSEVINALFRSVHSIKGSSGMFNFVEIEEFTHKVENILDGVRKGEITIEEELIGILLECHDYINILLDEYEKDNAVVIDDNLKETGGNLLKKLNDHSIFVITPAKQTSGETEQRQPCQPAPEKVTEEESNTDRVSSEYWHVSLRYKKDVFRNGLDPMSFINYLGEIAKIVKIICLYDAIPAFKEMDTESCYLGFEMLIDGVSEKKTIEDVFDFVKDSCDIRILPPMSRIADYVYLMNELPERPMRIGEILTNIGSLTQYELETALGLQQEMTIGGTAPDEKDKQFIGNIMVDEKMIHKAVLDTALEKQKEIGKSEERKSKSMRIDSSKLDDLINIVGELVITAANVRQAAERSENNEVVQPALTMSRLVEDVRDRIMNIRMVQIGETFKRFERIVRDLSRESGKEADLIVSGGDTELDKTIVEKISDPLMHLIRNSIDHGIDTPDERVRKGKPRRGAIHLNAYHETGSMVIEVKDDGSGLNRDKIYNKAIQSGLLQAGQSMEDNDLYQLIFEPGFTTATKVTNISGRGVGMDVVKKNIEALRGTVILESEEGSGMTVRIHLPLTLAIIEGFMVQVCRSSYVIPLDMVKEVFEITRDELVKKDGVNIINLRGEVLPFMRLRDFFGESDKGNAVENVIVVEYARKKAGLVVDTLVGEFQTVIKSLGKLFKELNWASGATILGSGEVALILDVPRLIQENQAI